MPAQARAEPGLGLGLKNIRERLHALYGERMRLTWKCGDTHFEVEITLPFDPEPAR